MSTIPQLFSAAAGAILCAGGLVGLLSRKTWRFKALFWMAVGAAMVFAGFRPRIIELLGQDSTELRVRLVVAFLSFVVLTVTLEAVRAARMLERYAFLWLATGSLLLAGAAFADVVRPVAAVTGMTYIAALMVIVFSFIMLTLFHLSVALSRMQEKLAQVARTLALAEERLRRAEAGAIRHRAEAAEPTCVRGESGPRPI